MKAALLIVALGTALSACSEKPQSANSQQRPDAPPHAGASLAFNDAGWKAGDKASWQEHLKVRAQRGQDDYYGRKN